MNRNSFYYKNYGILWNTLNNIPKHIMKFIAQPDFVINYDPISIGLHNHTDTSDGRSYRNTSHVCWDIHQNHLSKDKRATTIVLLDGDHDSRNTILHEIGHLLDERLNFDRPGFYPLNDYAETNAYEAFATSFQAYLTEPYLTNVSDGFDAHKYNLLEIDPEGYYFFDNLGKY